MTIRWILTLLKQIHHIRIIWKNNKFIKLFCSIKNCDFFLQCPWSCYQFFFWIIWRKKKRNAKKPFRNFPKINISCSFSRTLLFPLDYLKTVFLSCLFSRILPWRVCTYKNIIYLIQNFYIFSADRYFIINIYTTKKIFIYVFQNVKNYLSRN